MTTLQINNRNYHVREGHTTDQIIDSLVRQINNDKGCLYGAKRINDGFTLTDLLKHKYT